MATIARLETNLKTWTDEQFMALAQGGQGYKLVNGEPVAMGNSGALHSYVCSLLLAALTTYNSLSKRLGLVFDSSTAFTMANGNRRSPDVSFFAKDRLQGMSELPLGFLDGAPDLAMEVLSPGNTMAEIHDKLVEYFENGTRLAWVIHPGERYGLVYRSAQEPDRLLKSADLLDGYEKSADLLDGYEVIPGFTFPMADLFHNSLQRLLS